MNTGQHWQDWVIQGLGNTGTESIQGLGQYRDWVIQGLGQYRTTLTGMGDTGTR